MTAKASARFVRISPRKARQVVDIISGKKADAAMALLSTLPKKAAKIVSKVVSSAIANAENNHNMDRNKLRIKQACVDSGPIVYRYRPRAYGRAYRIRKRTSHITIELEES